MYNGNHITNSNKVRKWDQVLRKCYHLLCH